MYYKQRTTDSAQQPVDAKKKINKNKILKEKTGRRHNKSAHMHAYSITIHCVWVKCILYVGFLGRTSLQFSHFCGHAQKPGPPTRSRPHPSNRSSWTSSVLDHRKPKPIDSSAHANEVILRLFVAVVMMSGQRMRTSARISGCCSCCLAID